MVQRSRTALGALFAVVTTAQSVAFAQALPRLHVISFTMRADMQAPHAGEPFHLEIEGRLREPLSGVDFVVLPNLAGLEPLGDERHVFTMQSGTNFAETLTVVAHNGGAVHLNGAYFDAIDPRDGKAKRYYSNDLVLNVIGSTPAPAEGTGWLLALLMRLVAALLLVFLVGGLLFRKKARRPQPLVLSTPPQTIGQATPTEDAVSIALGDLKRARSRDAVMALRGALWKTAGARGGETLDELLSRNGVAGPLRASLRSLERAAFVADERLGSAIEDAIAVVGKQLS